MAELAQQAGIVWAVVRGDMLSLRSPPQVLWYLANRLLTQQQQEPSLSSKDLELLRCLRDAIPYPFTGPLHGEAFEYLTLVSEVCRRSLLAGGVTAVPAVSTAFCAHSVCIVWQLVWISHVFSEWCCASP